MLIFPNTTTTTIPEEICYSVNGVRPPNDRGIMVLLVVLLVRVLDI